MRIRYVEGTTEISSDGEILFHTYDGSAEFNALGKNLWTAPKTIIGDYENIQFKQFSDKELKVIAFIKPTNSYKGEFGIDWCEMDDTLLKIKTFQKTKIEDIEYVFDTVTNLYKRAGTDLEKQELIKSMYYSEKSFFGKIYYATWMNIIEGITAEVILTTWYIDSSKKSDGEKEFLTFKENINFKIEYDKKINNEIKIKIAKHKKEYEIKITAIKTFTSNEFIEIIDETGNTVSIIEMSANKKESIEIKIIPVVLKSKPTTQIAQAEAIYNKAVAAHNDNKLDLINTLNKQSLNQASIKSILVANPKGAEKLVIDITAEYKNYWNTSAKHLKDWKFTTTDIDSTKRPKIWKSEDGENLYEFKNGKVDNDTRMILDELEDNYYEIYGKDFKGALIFVVEENYTDPNTLGYSQSNPLRNKGTIIFKGGIDNADIYSHELGHMLGLEHTFFKDEKDFIETNSAIRNSENNIKIHENNIEIINGNYNPSIKNKEKGIKNSEESIIEYEKQILETKLKNIKEERTKWIEDEKESLERKKQERQDKIGARDMEIEEERTRISDEIEKLKINISHQFRTSKSKTLNFMDYDISRLYFSKYQCKTMLNETDKYF